MPNFIHIHNTMLETMSLYRMVDSQIFRLSIFLPLRTSFDPEILLFLHNGQHVPFVLRISFRIRELLFTNGLILKSGHIKSNCLRSFSSLITILSRKWGGSPRGDLLDGVEVRLEGADLWAKFFELGTEMIITKSGRSVLETISPRAHLVNESEC